MNYDDFESVGGCDDYIKDHVLIILRQIQVFPSGQVLSRYSILLLVPIEQPRREQGSLNVTKAEYHLSHRGHI